MQALLASGRRRKWRRTQVEEEASPFLKTLKRVRAGVTWSKTLHKAKVRQNTNLTAGRGRCLVTKGQYDCWHKKLLRPHSTKLCCYKPQFQGRLIPYTNVALLVSNQQRCRTHTEPAGSTTGRQRPQHLPLLPPSTLSSNKHAV